MLDSPKILQIGDPKLRVPATVVDDFSCPKLHELLAIMQNMMVEANGVGIAAPQLGISLQIIILASRPTARYPDAPEMDVLPMINPSFTVLSAELQKDWEGCLSVPGIRALVPRYTAILVNYQDCDGQARELKLTDFPARIFQHEFDHLQGLTYLDKVENNRDIYAESEFLKLINTASD